MQYKPNMTEKELQEYWQKPYCVKPELGFYTWPKPEVTLRVSDDTQLQHPDYVREAFLKFFTDQTKRDKFIELNSIEHKKGEDSFSMDKGLLYCSLIEEFGSEFAQILVPYVEKFSKSTEESEQRCAAEIVFGMIRGSRFWTYKPVSQLWNQVLIPCFKSVLSNVTTETIVDWEMCVSGGTKKADPNRIRWLYKLLMEHGQLGCQSSSEGAFSQASFLKLLNESISYNWRAKELYNEIFNQLKVQCNHPYNKVRLQISAIMATLLSIDIAYGDKDYNMGQGCPKVRDFLDEIIPKLTLNFHNPVLNGVRPANGVVYMDENSTSSSIMEVDNAPTTNPATNGKDDASKETNHILESVGIWIMQYIQVSNWTNFYKVHSCKCNLPKLIF